MSKTKIAWSEYTWNFQGGCTPVSEGCLHCAAARSAELCTIRGSKKYRGLTKNRKWTGELRFFPDELNKPLHWRKPRMIFPAFMSDLFHESVPFEWIARVFDVMCSWKWPSKKAEKNGDESLLVPTGHIYQILTKRPERYNDFVDWVCEFWPGDTPFSVALDYGKLPENIWFGVTAENQKAADERIPILLQIPAAVRFISCEPLLSYIFFKHSFMSDCAEICPEENNCAECNGFWNTMSHKVLHWVIVGCESGPGRRPCKLEWVRNIVHQCDTAGVPVFVKQLSINGKVEHDMNKFPEDLRIREYPRAKDGKAKKDSR